MKAVAALAAALLAAAAAHAAPIASFQSPLGASYNNFPSLAVDAGSLRMRIQVRGVSQFDALVNVGQAVTVSLTSGTVFDEIVALYTNGVTDPNTNLFTVEYAFNAAFGNDPTTELGLSRSTPGETADLPDLAGYVIDEFRITSTVTCFDAVNAATKDTCRPPVQVPLVELLTDLKVEFFGHVADSGGTVPEPGSAALAAMALLAAGGLRWRAVRG